MPNSFIFVLNLDYISFTIYLFIVKLKSHSRLIRLFIILRGYKIKSFGFSYYLVIENNAEKSFIIF